MTAALEGGELSAARPGLTLLPGETRYPFYRRLGGPQGRSERAKNLVPTGIRSRTVQPVVSRYTDWATRPTHAHTHIYTHTCVCVCVCVCRTCGGVLLCCTPGNGQFLWVVRIPKRKGCGGDGGTNPQKVTWSTAVRVVDVAYPTYCW